MQHPLVTVLMPVYNCESFVEDAIRSVLNQSYTNLEFLIIDDASTDRTLSIVKTFDDSRLKIIEKPLNTGYTESLNFGLGIARGKYIARMDGDDISLPERFAKQVAFMESHPDVVVCGTNYRILDGNRIKVMPETHEDIKLELLKNTCFGHPTVMIRKEILDRYSIVYNKEKEPAEDYDLWVTLLNYGQLHNLQEILLLYRVHDHQVSNKRSDSQLNSKLSTRLRLLQYIGNRDNETDLNILKKVLSDQALTFSELVYFIRIKRELMTSNVSRPLFSLDAFEQYLNTLEHSTVKLYFLKRTQFYPMIYWQYLKIKNQLHFKLPLKTDLIILIKSLLFFKSKKYRI